MYNAQVYPTCKKTWIGDIPTWSEFIWKGFGMGNDETTSRFRSSHVSPQFIRTIFIDFQGDYVIIPIPHNLIRSTKEQPGRCKDSIRPPCAG